METNTLRDTFKTKFEDTKATEIIVRSPGRVNLIGEHTDYNQGFVLPASIDKNIKLAVSKSDRDHCQFYSIDYNETATCFIEKNYTPTDKAWLNYLLGVLNELQKFDKEIAPFNCAFGGDIPIGSGLSSSAALQCGITFALNELFDLQLTKLEIAKLSQKAENEFVGVNCGIMDQFANLFGQKNKLIKLDCQSLEYQYHPLEMSGYKILLLDTQVKHSLANTEYNKRREECEAGVEQIKTLYPEITSLRDCDITMLEKAKELLPPTSSNLYNRCQYVIEENQRVQLASQDLEKGDLNSFGNRMYDSHNGLKDLYQVSCEELDILVDLTKNNSSVLGSRMMGGGFGGCTINLVQEKELDSIASEIKTKYQDLTGNQIKVYHTSISDGTNLLTS